MLRLSRSGKTRSSSTVPSELPIRTNAFGRSSTLSRSAGMSRVLALVSWPSGITSLSNVVGNCTCTEPEKTNVFPSGAKSRNSMSLTPSYLNTVSGCNAVFSLASSIPCCSRHSRAVLNATKIFPSDRRRERTATLERAAASVAIHPGRHEGRSSERRSIEDAADLLAFLPLKRDFKGRDGTAV